MARKSKEDTLFQMTSDIHDEIDSIYEDAVDGNNKEASKKIIKAVESLKHLKSSLVEKDEI